MNKIYIISKYLVTKETGFETRFAAISRHLVDKGLNVFLIGSNSNRVYFKESNFILYNYWNYNGLKGITFNILKYGKTDSISRIISWVHFEIYLIIYLIFHVKKGDILVCSSLSLLTGLTGAVFKRMYGVKFVFDVRDIWPLTLTEEVGYSSKSLPIRFLQSVEKFAYTQADLITGTMPRLDRHVKNVTGQNLLVHTIPFAPSTYLNYFRRPDPKNVGVLNNQKFNITYAGSINTTNALEFLIEAISKISVPTVHFNIIGDGDLLEKYKSHLSGYDNVTFYGSLTRIELLPYLEESDLLYFSAYSSKIWEYGWSPNKILDYMTSGTPILASYSGHRSMINEANSGFFVDAENVDKLIEKIELIVNEIPREDLVEMGRSGQNWIFQQRTWQGIATSFMNQLYLHNLI